MNAPGKFVVETYDPSAWHAEDAAVGPQSDAVFQQIGQITRQLHDTLERLGVMPQLQSAAFGLPDARSRLSYIAEKCGAAANKVLTSVDLAKAEQSSMAEATRALGAACAEAGEGGVDPKLVAAWIASVEAAHASTNVHLTDIMMAQDYHDLTGQVVAKVVALAIDLEDSLVKLLVQTAPPERVQAAEPGLEGPVHSAGNRSDVVTSQGEVDDLLATLGF